MREIPVTVVAAMVDPVKVYVVPGHHTKVKAVEMLVKSDSIDDTLPYHAWTTTFNPSIARQAAEALMETAKKLYRMKIKQ